MASQHAVLVEGAVDQLVEANRRRGQGPVVSGIAGVPLDVAYEVQDLVHRELHGDVTGYKVSMVAPEQRVPLGAEEPVIGVLGVANLLAGDTTIELGNMHCPVVEPELVFIVRKRLSLGASVAEVREKCMVAAGIELPDSRYSTWSRAQGSTVKELLAHLTLRDMIADNALASLVVHSEAAVRADSLDLAQMRVNLFKDGECIGCGIGSDIMNDPAESVAWLSRFLARRGRRLEPGQRVSSGSYFFPPIAERGEYWARFTGVGELRVTFA